MSSDSEIISDLQIPVKSFRLFALEQAIKQGASSELLQALQQFQAAEQDEECLCLLPHAIDAVRRRSSSNDQLAHSNTGTVPVSAQELATIFPLANAGQRLHLLLQIHADSVSQLVPWATGTIAEERDPAVLAQLIRIFGKHFPSDHLPHLSRHLTSPFVSVRCATIEAISSVDPAHIVADLSVLVQDEDPRVFAWVVKAMARVNAETTRGYLEHGLRSRDYGRKLEMLRAAVVLPFDIVKPPLLVFLALERDPGLLEKASLILQVNPDPDLPYQILELMSRADPQHLQQLTGLFESACQVIQDSGILGDQYGTYLAGIKAAVAKRQSLQRVRIARANLESDDEGDLAESEVLLAAPGSAPTAEPLPRPVMVWEPGHIDKEKFLELSLKEQSRFIAGLQEENLSVAIDFLHFVIESENTENKIKAVALRAASRYASGEFIPVAKKWIQGGDDSLVIASIEYLGRILPDLVLDLLGRFYTAANVRVQTAALKVLMASDPRQAVSIVMTILKNPNPRVRSSGMSCLMSFEFILIRNQLGDYFENHRDPELLEGALLLFQNNPDPENLFLLYRLETFFTGEHARSIQSTFRANVELVKELQLVSPEHLATLLESFPSRLKQLQSKFAQPVNPSPAGQAPVSKPQTLSVGPAAQGAPAVSPLVGLAVVGLIVLVSGWVIVGNLGAGEAIPVPSRSQAILAEELTIEATVTAILGETDEIMIMTVDHSLFKLLQNSDSRLLRVGDRIKAVVKPFRCTQDFANARFLGIEKQ